MRFCQVLPPITLQLFASQFLQISCRVMFEAGQRTSAPCTQNVPTHILSHTNMSTSQICTQQLHLGLCNMVLILQSVRSLNDYNEAGLWCRDIYSFTSKKFTTCHNASNGSKDTLTLHCRQQHETHHHTIWQFG